jgi:rfaE bifunctional protein nucleotidyltransferase chain/domain
MSVRHLFPAAACVQFTIRLGEPERNIEEVSRLIAAYRPAPDTLLVLPEMWATGFDYARTAEMGRRTPEILGAMQQMAAHHRVYLAGTLTALAEDGSLPFNMLYLVGPGGVIGQLPKQQLFTFWQEDCYYQGGPAEPLLQTPCGPFGGLVCYDLRFPEVARRQVFAGCRLLAVAAQWPMTRIDHWQTLLRARAIENQVYVVAANGCGLTGAMEMAGHSMLIGPDGTVLQAAGTEATVIGCNLAVALVDQQRSRFFPAGSRNWSREDERKISTIDDLLPQLDLIRRQGSRIAFTNGCFDILHPGHVSYLEQARRTGDCLVVGLNTDRSVRALKGPSRPVNSEADRARVLAALGCVDHVVLFDEETPLNLITAIHPAVLVKGADWPEDRIVGAAEVKADGGRVERIGFSHECSTTGLIDKIRTIGPAGAHDRTGLLASTRKEDAS